MRTEAVRTVLVADDDPDMVMILRVNLEAEGYSVEAAEDGRTAWAMARALRPDVVVLDVMMPAVDGLDVLARLRRDPGTCDIPVVLLTAKSSDQEIFERWRAGADYYLTKPFQFDELLHFIEYLGTQAAVHHG